MPLVEFKNYNLRLGKNFEALRGITFSIEAGETYALIGESGSGKTLTALSLMQMIPKKDIGAATGNIIFNTKEGEYDLLIASQKEMQSLRGKSVAMIFQEPLSALNPSLTCGYQLMESINPFNPKITKSNKDTAIRLLSEVELHDVGRILSAYPHQLSGGQRQRLMIAMALARDPELLIADEPTTALDVTVQRAIMQLLKKIQSERNLAILFISHDLHVVKNFAHQVAVMHSGKIVEQGDAASVFNHPAHNYTRALLECQPATHADKRRLPTAADFYSIDAEGNFISKNNTPLVASTEQNSTSKDTSEIIYDIRALTTSYKEVQVKLFRIRYLKKIITSSISFKIYKGETLVVIGESGSGKTTLARTILKLQKNDAGQILYKGRSLELVSKQQLLGSQMVYQDPYSSLNPGLKIGDVFVDILRKRYPKESRQKLLGRAAHYLADCGMPASTLERYAHQFSGGQRQRISIARTLATSPDFIILDEPVAALDISLQAQVLNLLKDLKEKHQLTYVIITHDIHVARFMADTILVLKKGEVAEYGTAEKVLNTPSNEYTKSLLHAAGL